MDVRHTVEDNARVPSGHYLGADKVNGPILTKMRTHKKAELQVSPKHSWRCPPGRWKCRAEVRFPGRSGVCYSIRHNLARTGMPLSSHMLPSNLITFLPAQPRGCVLAVKA